MATAQKLHLPRFLHAFGDEPDAERARERRNRLYDRRVLRARGDVAHEAPVDLQAVDRKALEIAKRRIAGAEVVDGDDRADCLEVGQRDHHAMGTASADQLRVRQEIEQRAGSPTGARAERHSVLPLRETPTALTNP